jgi:hypothetical protein
MVLPTEDDNIIFSPAAMRAARKDEERKVKKVVDREKELA